MPSVYWLNLLSTVLGDSRIHLIDSKPLPVANPKL